MLIKFLPVLLGLAYVAAMWFLSSRRLRAELATRSTPLTHPRLLPVLEQLGRAMDLPAVRAHVYEVAPVNGLAAPDGRIFLTRGFLDKLDQGWVTPEELASVIAHELGHVAHGHHRRRIIDFAGQNAVRGLLIGTLGRMIPFVGGWLADLIATAFAKRLSRQDEYEADAFASALMVKAGFGTAPQKSLFRKLAALSDQRGGQPPVWLMSHPKPEQRIAAIETLEARWRLNG